MQMNLPEKLYTTDGLWWEYVKKKWLFYTIGSLSIAVTAFGQVFTPRCIGWGIDLLRGEKIPDFFWKDSTVASFNKLFFILVITHLILFLGRIGWRIFLANQTYHAGSWLRASIWEKVRFFPKAKLEQEYTTGVLMNASTSDVNTSRFIYGFTLVAAFDVLFLGAFTLFTMVTINLEMTLWTLVMYPAFPYFLKKLSRIEGERYQSAQEYLSSFNDMCAQAISTIRLQRLTQTGKFWEKKLIQTASDYREKRIQAIYTSLNFFPVMGIGTLLSYLVLFLVGINKVINGGMSVGEFVAMQSYVLLIQDPMMELGFIISEWQRSRTSLSRLSEIYNEKEAPGLVRQSGPTINTEEKLVVKVQDLSYKYADGERQILKNLNLELYKGQRLGVTGPIGSGKTTFLNLISGLEDKQEGTILLYNQPISSYTHGDLRKCMSLVPQRPFLFADTIKNNISMDKSLSDEEIWHYLEMAGLKDDVFKFPHQLQTQLGEWGINLSGGQKQRLTLGRALAARPILLLLDDCLSAVDTVTEEIILTALDKELRHTTLIWVAHRKSTLKYCDKILELNL